MQIKFKKLVSVMLIFSLVITLAPIIGKGNVVYAETVNISDNTSHKVEGNILTFTCGSQEVIVELCTSRMARVKLSVDGTYRQPDDTYYMVQKNDWAPVTKDVSDEGTYIKIETDDMVIRVQKSPVRVQMYKKDNITLLSKDTDDQGMYSDTSTGVRGVKKVEGPGGGGIFGFGTGDHGRSQQLNKYDLDVTDFGMDHGQLIAPFYMSTVGYGIFLNTIETNTKFFKRGGGFETKDYLDYYFIYGPDFKTILNQYAELTGRMELYGKWAHGFMLSKYGNDNATQSEFLDWLEHLRGVGKYEGQEPYPSDGYVFDYGWRGEKWDPHRWNTERFPDLAEMFAKADEMGFTIGLHNNKGTPESKVNASDPSTQGGRFLDPTVRDKWVKAHMDNVIKPGYGDWFWPDEFDIAEGSTRYNWMPTYAAKPVYEAWQDYTDQSRPMFVTRGSYAGQHFATAWSGDIENTTSEMGYQIGYGIESGLVGYWTTTHDLGGFKARPNDNLYTRWVAEFGAWNGMMRAHGHDGREPWTFSTTAQDTLKQNLKIRYALYPYTYSLAWQGYSQGVPMMRPMFLEDGNQSNPDTWNLNKQYYYGDWFLVAPALSESDTTVKLWFPANTTWYNYYTGMRYEGGASGKNLYVDAKLTEIPVFVKSGAIVPMGPDVNYADEKPLDPLTLDIYPRGDTTFTLFEDDGLSREYITENAYSTTKFDSHQNENNITFKINKRFTPNPAVFEPVERSYNLKFNHIQTVRGVTVNGSSIQAVDSLENYNAAGEVYWLDSVNNVVYVKTADTGEEINISLDSDGIVEPALGGEGSAGTVINPGDKFELEKGTMTGASHDIEWKGYTGTGFAKGFKAVGNNVEFTADIQKGGNYNLVLRTNCGKKNSTAYDSTPRGGALYLNASKVADFAIPVTETWGDASKNGDWREYTIPNIRLQAGMNTFKINAEGSNAGNYNLDSLRFDYVTVDAFGTIEAETASTRQGVDVASCSDVGGGKKLNHIENGDWVIISDVNFGTDGINGFEARLASGLQGGTLEVWIDSMADQRAVELKFGSTGSWNTWNTIQASSQTVTGVHDVYLKFVNTESAASICDLNWIRFLKDYTPTNAEKVAADKAVLNIGFATGDSTSAVTQNLNLPVIGAAYGSSITWESSNTAVISNTGIVTRPDVASGNANVTMTANVSIDGVSDKKIFNLTVLENVASNNASLTNITLEGITLNPNFNSEVTSYGASVPNSTSSTTVTATPAQSGAIVEINGTVTTSQALYLAVGSNTVTIEVTAEDDTTTKTYTISINRANSSSQVTTPEALTIDIAALNIGFGAGDNISAVTKDLNLPVLGEVYDSSITWESNNTAVISNTGIVTRPAFGSGNANVTMTATLSIDDVSDSKIFNLTVLQNVASNNASLTNITLEGINLNPKFSGDVISYNASVPNSTSSTTVTVTPAQSNAIVNINGTATESKAVDLAVGSNTVTIEVTAEDDTTTKTYTINIIREDSTQVPITAVADVTLDKSAAGVKVGRNVQLTATVLPADATDRTVTWSTSDAAVATVDRAGKVTAVKAGTATITVTTTDGGKTARCVVTVTRSNNDDSSSGSSDGDSTVIPAVTPSVVPTPVVPTETSQSNEVVKVSLSLINGTTSGDGVNIPLTVKPYVEQGRTMAGIRDIANILQIENKNIIWNNNTKEVTIKTNGKEIKLILNQKYAMVDGKKVAIDVAPQIKDGRTVLPIAHIARILGMNVTFDTNTKEVTFSKEQ